MSQRAETDAELPPWVVKDSSDGESSSEMRLRQDEMIDRVRDERDAVAQRRANISRRAEIAKAEAEAIAVARTKPKHTRKTKRNAKPPEAGEWEVQVRTGQSGRAKWGWLQSVQGFAPDKGHIRDSFGPGHYRVVEQGSGYVQEFTIARLPASNNAEPQEAVVAPEPPADIEALVEQAVANAVKQAMTSTMQAMRPFIESMKPKPGQTNEAVEQLRDDLSQLSGLVRAIAERPAPSAPALPAGPPWQMAIIEKVMTAGLTNMGIAHDDDEEEDESPGMEEKLLDIGTTLLGAVMQNRAAQPPPHHGGQPQQALPGAAPAPGQPAPTPGTLPGMTPEIEAELRAYATKIGYDYDTAIAEANSAGASAQALLDQCRSLIGPLEKS